MASGGKSATTDPHLKGVDTIIRSLGSDKNGLDDKKAAGIRELFGPNELKEGKKTPKWVKFLRQFTDPLVIVLLIAAGITAVIEPTGIDWMVIGAIVLINSIIGYVQEEKAEDAIAKLKKMSAPKAMVFRNGKRKEVAARITI